MIFNDAAQLLLSHAWRFAKTMPQNPHWYTLRKTWQNQEDFNDVVLHMREHGYQGRFGGRPYTYFNVNDFYYWTMGAPVRETILINKKKIDYSNQYDLIAGGYDSLFADDESMAENKEVVLMAPVNGRVLDIGCGTGLLLDESSIDQKDYVGIDPSAAMLSTLRKKHPEYATVECRFEDFFSFHKFDSIVSLFGSASYIDPVYFRRINEMLRQVGEYFLMLYKPGYEPITHIKTGISPKIYGNDLSVFPGASISDYRNFVIVRGGKV